MDEQPALFTDFPAIPTSGWEEKIREELKGGDYDKKPVWQTAEGFRVKPYYRAEDLNDLPYLAANPAESPFVRGTRKDQNTWIIRQDIETSDITKANTWACDAIKNGAQEVGLNVKNIRTTADLKKLLEGIDPEKQRISFMAATSFPGAFKLLLSMAKEMEVSPKNLQGSLNFDPLSYLLLKGTFYQTWEANLVEGAELIRMAKKHAPAYRTLTVNAHYFADAGATIVQELGYALSAGNEYLANLTTAGIPAEDIFKRMIFSFAISGNYFMEIAKFRAARLLWSKVAEAYGVKPDISAAMFIHAMNTTWNKTLPDPYVNMLRTTTEAMSAILGGADSLNVLPFDITYKEPEDFSRRVARNQQNVLKEEAYLDKIVDPAAGSYYIEHLTDVIASHAWNLFLEIEKGDGFLNMVKSGKIQEAIHAAAASKENDITQRKMTFIGINQYPNLQEELTEALKKPAPELELELEPELEPKHPPVIPLRLTRGTAAFDILRLATEKYVHEGHKRPSVFLFTTGNLAMRRARSTFISNFFGCAGYDVIDTPGFTIMADGVKAALESGAEIVVICSSDEEYPTLAPEIAKGLKEKAPTMPLLIAGNPKEHLEMLKQAGIDDFIHVRSNLLETLDRFNHQLGVTR
ncbi:MAG: methylmalonyl-CoA mutase small subunit [Bacteroidetes bacterium]|nr:methylmalonyl-CoA mutase small subunit [Bacteroidota bacterium]